MELSPQQIQAQIAKYKVKEGHLFKRFGFFNNQWKQRWIILTENYLMSFEEKNIYKACELLPIEDIQTLKSYFKRQQQRDLSFRAECKKENFYLAARNNQDKWAWIMAIERIIDKKQTRVFNPKAQQYDPLKEKKDGNHTLQQFYENGIKNLKRGSKHLKGSETKSKQLNKSRRQSQSKNQSLEQECTKALDTTNLSKQQKQSHEKPNDKIENKQTQKLTQSRIEEQKSQSPATKSISTATNSLSIPVNTSIQMVQNQNSKMNSFLNMQQSKDVVINKLFEDILSQQRDMRFFVDFIANLALDQNLQYADSVVEACINHPKGRYFIESLVKVFSQQTQQHPMNILLLFMVLIHEYYGNYFYTTDLKVLVDNLIRGLQLYKSQLNHYYILQVIQALISTDNWPSLPQAQKKQLKQLIHQIQKTSPSQTNQTICKDIIQCI